MSTDEFREGLERLVADMGERSTAVMCAEAVPWSCHRYLLADAVVARGIEVIHIMGAGSTRPHAINPAARVQADGTIQYPADDPQFGLL
jgi:uncharacterized protein (DUF488 family)